MLLFFSLTLRNTKKLREIRESYKKEVKFELVIKILIYWQWEIKGKLVKGTLPRQNQ